MKRLMAILMLGGTPAVSQELIAPSGLKMTLYEVIIEQDVPLARFRFEVPEIAGNALPFVEIADDMQALCDETLLPGLKQSGWEAGQIIMQLSAQEVVFGASVPEVTQYFQPFTIGPDTCIWEDY